MAERTKLLPRFHNLKARKPFSIGSFNFPENIRENIIASLPENTVRHLSALGVTAGVAILSRSAVSPNFSESMSSEISPVLSDENLEARHSALAASIGSAVLSNESVPPDYANPEISPIPTDKNQEVAGAPTKDERTVDGEQDILNILTNNSVKARELLLNQVDTAEQKLMNQLGIEGDSDIDRWINLVEGHQLFNSVSPIPARFEPEFDNEGNLVNLPYALYFINTSQDPFTIMWGQDVQGDWLEKPTTFDSRGNVTTEFFQEFPGSQNGRVLALKDGRVVIVRGWNENIKDYTEFIMPSSFETNDDGNPIWKSIFDSDIQATRVTGVTS